jgi:hypothetical protein
VILRGAYEQPTFKNIASSLYQGIAVAMVYAALQRAIKFGGQPILYKYLDGAYGNMLRNRYGDKSAKTLMEAGSGFLMGFFVEPLTLLPLDTIKVRFQVGGVQPDARFPGILGKFFQVKEIVKKEGAAGLYDSLGPTMIRNGAGSLTLFGLSAYIQHHVFHLDNCRDASFWQTLASSMGGAVGSVLATNPMDVVKVRLQAEPGKGYATKVIKDMFGKEGIMSFTKGLGLRLLVAGPKLTLVKTTADVLTHRFDRFFETRKEQRELAKQQPPQGPGFRK